MKLLSILVAGSALLATALPALAQIQESPTGATKGELQVPAVPGEITDDQIAKATDQDLSCPQLRSEVRSLASVVARKEELAEKVQAESFDRAAMAQSAAKVAVDAVVAEKRSLDFTIASRSQTQVALTPAKAPKAAEEDPPAPRTPPAREGEALPVSEPFKTPTRPAVTPTQIRQYRLLEILYHKGC